jgi:glycosyltransferase involved in cell wall biosynthesis
MLADGLAGRGVAVTVAGPSAAAARLAFPAVPPGPAPPGPAAPASAPPVPSPAVSFAAVEIGARPRPGDLVSILRLRRLLTARGGTDVMHAHGLRAGALSLIALTLVRGGRRPRTVVTAHNAPPPGGGGPALVYRLLERLVARRADLVLCVSPDLEARMRAAGARRVERAVIAAPDDPDAQPGSPLGVPTGRPVVLGAGRLAPQKGFGVLLEAAAAWRDLDPAPLVVIAGDGPLGGELMAKAAELGVDAVFVGHRADVPALLAIAAVFVLPSQWEGQPLVLQEALRAGTPVVATRVGGIPDLAGDEALLVPPEDAPALAAAVRSVLTDPLLGAALRVAAASRASLLPSPADAVDAALAVYAAR